jgi:hypothetical protein
MGLSISHAQTTISLIHEPHVGFADLSVGEFFSDQSNRAGTSFITDFGAHCTLARAIPGNPKVQASTAQQPG